MLDILRLAFHMLIRKKFPSSYIACIVGGRKCRISHIESHKKHILVWRIGGGVETEFQTHGNYESNNLFILACVLCIPPPYKSVVCVERVKDNQNRKWKEEKKMKKKTNWYKLAERHEVCKFCGELNRLA